MSLSACTASHSLSAQTYEQDILSTLKPSTAKFVSAPSTTVKPMATVLEVNAQKFMCFDQANAEELSEFLKLHETTSIINSANVSAANALQEQFNYVLKVGQVTEQQLNQNVRQINSTQRAKTITTVLGGLGLGAVVTLALDKD